MRSGNLLKIAARSIARNKMRSLLTMLGIVIGVAAVIVMVAVGDGAQTRIREQIDNLGTNMIVITPGSSSAGGVNRGAGSFNRLTLDDAEALERESLLLTAVSPVIFTHGQIIGGQGNWRAPIMGVDTDYAVIRDWPVSAGRWFDQEDVRAKRKVALIGATIAEELYAGTDPVGQRIQLRNVPFTIVGVLAEKGQTAEGSDQDDVVLAPYTTVQTRLAGRSFIGQILASTSAPEQIEAAQADVRLIMRDSHALGDWEEDDFTVRNQTELAEAAQGTTEVMTLLLAAIASISLLVGGIGIMNIMLVSVTERTREIGIRMAIGARGGDILTQFLVESTVMSLLGGFIGVATGYLGSALLGRITGWDTAILPHTVAVALLFSAGVGIFFGFYPARKAAALNPIEALRHE
ncbi:MAG: ABC transporter permease [Candidatus Krumholzibacteriota bacterium]|nr:ABC transporter permease [Candidatus Krumholzibacteriota bacterium]